MQNRIHTATSVEKVLAHSEDMGADLEEDETPPDDGPDNPIVPGTCLPWSGNQVYGQHTFTHSHFPYLDHYRGPLTIAVDAYVEPNQFNVRDQRGVNIISTSSVFSGREVVTFNYDSSVNGAILISVQNPGNGNEWGVEIICP